jgi:hypothetical protein
LGLTRRQFIIFAAIAAGTPHKTVAKPKSLTGMLLGLTTLNGNGSEVSELFRLDLDTGRAGFKPLRNYRFGHSLEPLGKDRWLAVPYGDDSQPCLILDRSGNVIRPLSPPVGYGFGGHAVVLDGGENIFLHYNPGEKSAEGAGQAEILNATTGQSVASVKTSIIQGHDMILARNGQIVIADDGALDSLDENTPYVLDPVRPALHFYTKELEHIQTMPLQINGSLVHIAENDQGTIIGAVEQYVRRNDAGLEALAALFGEASEDFMGSFDPEIFDFDVPMPGAIVSVASNGEMKTAIAPYRHLDPFDIAFNSATNTTCCVFTESNLVAFQQQTSNWQYLELGEFGLNSPFGLTNLGASQFIAVNDFEHGVAILDTTDMSLAKYFDVPTQGVKHLSYSSPVRYAD